MLKITLACTECDSMKEARSLNDVLLGLFRLYWYKWNIGVKSLEKEAMHLEARLTTARADLRKAEDVRVALDGAREQDEVRGQVLILYSCKCLL